MTRPSTELLVLDGQGVVFSDLLATFLAQLAHVTGRPTETVQCRWCELRHDLWTGRLSEPEFWRQLVGSDDGGHWGTTLEASYSAGPAAGHLPVWSSQVPIWLLSNHVTAWMDRRLARLDLRRWFDRILVSDVLGFTKPDPRAFAHVLAAVSQPAAALFVDDQAHNVEAARDLGLTAVLADRDGLWRREVEAWLRPRQSCG